MISRTKFSFYDTVNGQRWRFDADIDTALIAKTLACSALNNRTRKATLGRKGAAFGEVTAWRVSNRGEQQE